MTDPQPQQPPPFDPDAAHQQRPRLRPVRGFPVNQGDRQLLGIADARQVSEQVVFTLPQAQAIFPHMNGENDIDGIVEKVGHGLTRQMLEQLVAQLDQAGLIEGPTFDAMLQKMREEYDSASHLPPGSTEQFSEALVADRIAKELSEGGTKQVEQQAVQERMGAMDPADRREKGREYILQVLDGWMDRALQDAENPSFDTLPKAVIAPHLDYPRGWLNYAHVYGRMRVADRPDRIVILGTNHFGAATGVCGCDKGFESPLGVCEVDDAFVGLLREKLGDEGAERLFAHRYDHEREHSIELHMPWIQRVFGDEQGVAPKVFGALVHDPVHNNGESYDGEGLDIHTFIEAMKAAIEAAPGRTLVIASADLSHVGASFGDRRPVAGDSDEAKAFRNEVVQHDQEMLKLVSEAKPEELVASMAWMQNKTRWCSIGNLVATMKITDAESVQLLNYVAAADPQGIAMVTSCAAYIA